MPDTVTELFDKSDLIFEGTVTHLGESRVASVPADEHTAVVRVSQVLHAKDAFARLAGSEVTVRLTDDRDPPAVGETDAFFTGGAVYGEGLVVQEIGRLPTDDVRQHVEHAATLGERMPLSDLERTRQNNTLLSHAEQAAAVVVGIVVGQEQLGAEHTADTPVTEHDPDWWLAHINVVHVERGDVSEGPLDVLYSNSRDIHWHTAPAPEASQEGMFLLHATEGDLAEVARFQIRDRHDVQPVHRLETMQAARR
ncbi:hypothetical protein [Streptomyces sp. NPDC020298]|uniref:hypothetical protein n=1 Tax=unclassified Streptomyces TaxID=2593676 RepID=UPI003410FFF0